MALDDTRDTLLHIVGIRDIQRNMLNAATGVHRT
jgi:hypothetical protein